MTEEQRQKLLDAAASLSILAYQAHQRQQDNHALHLEQLRQRVELTQAGEEVTARDLSPARVARAASSLDAAALVLGTPTDADPDARARNPFDDQLYAVERAVEAVELVFASVRSHALDNDDPVARLWRDVRIGAHHARALISRLRMLGA